MRSNLGVTFASLVLAAAYFEVFKLAYPRGIVDYQLLILLAIAGFITYLVLRFILNVTGLRRIFGIGQRRPDAKGEAAARAAVEQGLRELNVGARPNEMRCYVSYAWADSGDPEREKRVDQLCEEAKKRGLNILRDKTTLSHGDLISAFMQKIGEGDRVFIFLSDKYLRSPYCMFELFEIWRNSRQNKDEFLKHVRYYPLDGAKISEPDEWLEYTEFWKQKRDALEALIEKVGWRNAGEAIRRHKHMETFTGEISNILAYFADGVQPRNFEDFLKYGFADLP